jgi:hypothetical protein
MILGCSKIIKIKFRVNNEKINFSFLVAKKKIKKKSYTTLFVLLVLFYCLRAWKPQLANIKQFDEEIERKKIKEHLRTYTKNKLKFKIYNNFICLIKKKKEAKLLCTNFLMQ